MASIAAVGTRIGLKISICAYQGHPLGCKLLTVLERPYILMVIKILLVIPVTNATYETEVLVVSAESKTIYCTCSICTMYQQRLNYVSHDIYCMFMMLLLMCSGQVTLLLSYVSFYTFNSISFTLQLLT